MRSKKTEKPAPAPGIGKRLDALESRQSAVEHRLGIDHAEIAADVDASLAAGAEAAALSEPPAEAEAE